MGCPSVTSLAKRVNFKSNKQNLRAQLKVKIADRCMDGQKRSTSKVTDYRKFHLLGDLDQVVQGRVSSTIDKLESITKHSNMEDDNATSEQLQELLKEQKETSSKLQQQVKAMKIRNELEAERLQQEQWQLALEKLRESREQMSQQHDENMDRIRNSSQDGRQKQPSPVVAWIQEELAKSKHASGDPTHIP